jgi:preprotein translocase subunit SecA
MDAERAETNLINLADDSIQAEKEHILNTVDDLLKDSKVNLDDQVEERLDLLDTFVEGLSLSDEPVTSNAKKLSREISDMLRLPLEISPEVAKNFRDDPYDVLDGLKKVVREAMQMMTIRRLIGAVERVLKTSLEISPDELVGKDWDTLANRLNAAIEEIFVQRREHYIGDDEDRGQIVRELSTEISKLEQDQLSRQDLLRMMLAMPQGRQQTFDKKTHRRVWKRTTRLTYTYHAASFLEDQPSEEITQEVLTHLEQARYAIQQAWGQSELTRLQNTRPEELAEDAQDGLNKALGEETFADIQDQPMQRVDESVQEQIIEELGRQALTKIYRQLLLRVISRLWVDYLTEMEALRVAIGLEAYAQRDPLVQYKTKAFEMFQKLLQDMRVGVATRVFTFQPQDVGSVQAALKKADVPAAQIPSNKR